MLARWNISSGPRSCHVDRYIVQVLGVADECGVVAIVVMISRRWLLWRSLTVSAPEIEPVELFELNESASRNEVEGMM